MLKGENLIFDIQFHLVDDLLYFINFFNKMRLYLLKKFKKKSFNKFITKTHILNLIKRIKLLRVIISLRNLFIDFIVIFIIVINTTLIK